MKDLNSFINDTDMLNENIQAQVADTANVEAKASAGSATESKESNPVENASEEQKNDQVDNNAAAGSMPLKEATGKKREELTKEQEKDVKGCVSDIIDMTSVLAGIFMQPNGKLVDFSDKEGRKLLIDTAKAFKMELQKSIKEANLENKDYATMISNAIPKKIDAELVQEDRDRVDVLKRYWKFWIGSMFLSTLIACATFFYSGYKYSGAMTLSAELEQWYVDNQNAVIFGNYLKKFNPKTYEYWHSGRWQRDKALQDSIKEASMHRGWK